jgi:amino acid transporter
MSVGDVKVELFVRNATGLVREIGPFGAFMIPWLTMAGAGITFFSVQVVYSFPNGSVPVAFAILAVPTILNTVVIALLGATMPRSAGGYVWSTRFVDPLLGWFSSGWMYWIVYIFSNGLLGGVFSTVLVTIFAVMGAATHISALTGFSNLLATNATALVGITFVVLIIVGLASVLEIKYYMRIMYAFFIISFIGLVFSVALFLLNNPGTIQTHWDTVWGVGSYNSIQTLAAKYNSAGYVAKVSTGFWGDTLGTVGLIFYALTGYEGLAYAAGEVRNPRSAFLRWYIAGMVATVVWYIIVASSVYHAYGDFIFKYDYVYNLYSSGSLNATDKAGVAGFMFSPNMALFAASLGSTAIVQILASLWFWPLSNLFPQYLFANRVVFGMAFDRMFPQVLTQVSERTHTPVYASLFNIVMSCIWAVLAFSTYGFLVSGSNLSFFVAFFYFIYSLAAMALPFKRPEIWEKGPRKTIFGIPEMAVLGAFSAGGMLWILALSTLGISATAWNASVLWLAVGVIVMLYYIQKNQKRGIKAMDIYKEIPPP